MEGLGFQEVEFRGTEQSEYLDFTGLGARPSRIICLEARKTPVSSVRIPVMIIASLARSNNPKSLNP